MTTVYCLPTHGGSDETANHQGRISGSSWKAQEHQIETNLSDKVTSSILLSTESQPDRNVLCEGQRTPSGPTIRRPALVAARLISGEQLLWIRIYYVELNRISRYPANLDIAE